ncbi:MAG: DNA-directed RNA polymerase subunit alpha [Patescibacteria group bacterium]
MIESHIVLPGKPRIVSEDETKGIYEIDGLFAGYGHTLGNSLRRIILSSMPGCAITTVKITGVPHEFSTISGVKEDVISLLLNLKRIRFQMTTDEPQTVTLSVKGGREVTAGDVKAPSQVTVINKDLHIATLTEKSASLEIEMTIERGMGYVAKEARGKGKMEVGTIAVDAIFTPVRRVNYEVENMRVGEHTDYNRLRMTIETDGTVAPHAALETSIDIMIRQLKAIVGFKESEPDGEEEKLESPRKKEEGPDQEVLKTRIENLNFSTRTSNALLGANIRTVGGLSRKKEEDLLDIDGLGPKGIQEIKQVLGGLGITLK